VYSDLKEASRPGGAGMGFLSDRVYLGESSKGSDVRWQERQPDSPMGR
jgi:hypothetical protein